MHLEILMSGPMVFRRNDDKSWSVFLPDLDQGARISKNGARPEFWIQQHFSFLVVAAENLPENAPDPLLRAKKFRGQNKGEFAFYDLRGCRVQVPTTVKNEALSVNTQPKKASPNSMLWVPALEDPLSEVPGFEDDDVSRIASVSAELLDEDGIPFLDGRLASVLQLDAGYLSVAKLTTEEVEPTKWFFAIPGDEQDEDKWLTEPDAVAAEVSWNLADTSGTVRLVQTGGQVIEIPLIDPSGTGPTVRIVNRELEEILGLAVQNTEPEVVDADFEANYLLSADPAIGLRSRPLPYSQTEEGGTPRITCGSTRARDLA